MKQLPPLRMTYDHIFYPNTFQHSRRDLACKCTSFFMMAVLRSQADTGMKYVLLEMNKMCKRRSNNNCTWYIRGNARLDFLQEMTALLRISVHLPVSSYDFFTVY